MSVGCKEAKLHVLSSIGKCIVNSRLFGYAMAKLKSKFAPVRWIMNLIVVSRAVQYAKIPRSRDR